MAREYRAKARAPQGVRRLTGSTITPAQSQVTAQKASTARQHSPAVLNRRVRTVRALKPGGAVVIEAVYSDSAKSALL